MIPPAFPVSADRAGLLSRVCDALTEGRTELASGLIQSEYPGVSAKANARKYSKLDSMRVFRRDGFIDRYTGVRMVFPGTLRLLSSRLPEAFRFHKNWKMAESHYAFWELSPTIDHVLPVTRGGTDDFDNLVTTSMARNSAKANFTLDELGWSLVEAGRLEDWDGLLGWFMRQSPSASEDPYVTAWYRAAQAALAGFGSRDCAVTP